MSPASGVTLVDPSYLIDFSHAVDEDAGDVGIALANIGAENRIPPFGQAYVSEDAFPVPHQLARKFAAQRSDILANLATLQAALAALSEAALAIYRNYNDAQNLERVSTEDVAAAFTQPFPPTSA